MSGFTQYVIADKRERQQVADNGYPIEKWRGCDGFKFFAADGLGHLYWIIKKGAGSHEDFPLTIMGEYGWIHDIPQDMVAYLASSSEKDLPDLANAWVRRIAEKECSGIISQKNFLPSFGTCKSSRLRRLRFPNLFFCGIRYLAE